MSCAARLLLCSAPAGTHPTLPFRHWSIGWWVGIGAMYNPTALAHTTRVTHTYSLAVVRSVCVVSV